MKVDKENKMIIQLSSDELNRNYSDKYEHFRAMYAQAER